MLSRLARGTWAPRFGGFRRRKRGVAWLTGTAVPFWGFAVTYVVLGLAILSEVIGTVSLKLADGFSRPLPSVLVVLGYVAAFVALASVLKAGMPVGVAYAIWSAAGVALVALIGAAFLGEGLTLVQVFGLVLILAGVVALELGAKAS